MPLKLVRHPSSPNWYLRGTVRGTPVYETTGTRSKEHAEAIRIKREAELLDESVFGPRVSRTFAEAALRYMEAPGSPERERRLIFPLIDHFGSMRLADITQAAVDSYITTRHAGHSAATVQRATLTPLIAVLNHVSPEWCAPPKFRRPKQPKGRNRWATQDEANRMIRAAQRHIKPLLAFLFYTGARMSEALYLDWSDVNLAEGWVVFRDTKNGEDRGVPLHADLVVILANLPIKDKSKGRVFLTRNNTPYHDPKGGYGGQIKTAWRTLCKTAKIADMAPHDCRHTFSTWLTMAGVHEQVRDELMGHASTDMGRRYSHVVRDQLVEAVNRLPRIATREEIVEAVRRTPKTPKRIKRVA